MFEYIKRVSIAISFIAQKIDLEAVKMRNILSDLSFDLLFIAQNFRTDNYKSDDLKALESKIVYLIDLIDFARINNYISPMNAKVFVDSMLTFLKHILNLIDHKNSHNLPLYHLRELDETFARKQAKDREQTKFGSSASNSEFGFSELPTHSKRSSQNLSTTASEKVEETAPIVIPETPTEIPKKILEESMIYPDGSLEYFEKEIHDRRGRILNALIAGGGSIKEIATKLKDISEKTIQRDLLELMRDKKVIMLGKKRWSKYYLK